MNIKHRAHIVIITSAMAFALAACGQKEEPTVGQQLDNAITNTEQAMSEARQDLQAAASDLRRDGEQAAQSMAESASDMAITAKVKTALAADDQLSALSIQVDTVDGVVSLSGPAPSADAVERATVLARAVDGVNAVENRLVVEGKS